MDTGSFVRILRANRKSTWKMNRHNESGVLETDKLQVPYFQCADENRVRIPVDRDIAFADTSPSDCSIVSVKLQKEVGSRMGQKIGKVAKHSRKLKSYKCFVFSAGEGI